LQLLIGFLYAWFNLYTFIELLIYLANPNIASKQYYNSSKNRKGYIYEIILRKKSRDKIFPNIGNPKLKNPALMTKEKPSKN